MTSQAVWGLPTTRSGTQLPSRSATAWFGGRIRRSGSRHPQIRLAGRTRASTPSNRRVSTSRCLPRPPRRPARTSPGPASPTPGYGRRNAAIPDPAHLSHWDPAGPVRSEPCTWSPLTPPRTHFSFGLSGGEVTSVCRGALVRTHGHVQDQGGPTEAGSRSRPARLAGQRVIELPETVGVDEPRQLVA